MNKQQHLDFLSKLDESYGEGRMAWPKAEGAFYFGHYLSYDEYVDRYRAECLKNGWEQLEDVSSSQSSVMKIKPTKILCKPEDLEACKEMLNAK